MPKSHVANKDWYDSDILPWKAGMPTHFWSTIKVHVPFQLHSSLSRYSKKENSIHSSLSRYSKRIIASSLLQSMTPASNLSDCSPNGSIAKSPVYCSISGRDKRRLISGLYCISRMHAHFLWPPRRKGSKENATRNSPSKCRVGLERAEGELGAP